ncbi:polysaccharide pyruvyl transferase family protein [Pseudomonas silvicola]|nr:polysaccharide pyruvyl transferase family protein [Pseudomonas silvicola]
MKIAQVGTFDLDNLGDLLFPWVTSRLFASVHGAENQLEYHCFSPTEGAYFYSDQCQYKNIDALDAEDAVAPFDWVLIGGGDLLRDDDYSLYAIYGEQTPALTFTSILSPTVGGTRRLAVLAAGLPYEVEGDFREFLTNSFSRLKAIALRDSRSAAYLQPCVDVPISIVPDFVHAIPSFLPQAKCDDLVRAMLPEFEQGYLCFQGHGDVCEPVDIAAQTLKDIEQRVGKPFVLIEIGGCLGDTDYLEKLSDITGYPLVSRGKFPEITLEQKVAVIAASHGFIGSSLHGNIISNAYGVKNFSYVGKYSHKITEYFSNEGHGILFSDFSLLRGNVERVVAVFEADGGRKQPLTALKTKLILDFITDLIRSSPGAASAFSPAVDSIYKRAHAKSSFRESIVRSQLADLGCRLAAEKQNAVEQVEYRDRLIEELRGLHEAEKENSFAQITYRDKLIEVLEAQITALKEKSG